MVHVNVTIRTVNGEIIAYPAIVPHAVDATMNALTRFGICKITVRPA